MKPIGTLLLLGFFATSAVPAQGLEEVVVTGARRDEGASMPGTFLRKTGDFCCCRFG